MRRLSLFAFPFVLAMAPALATAVVPCTDTCKTLLDEGRILVAQGHQQQALEKFKAAIAAAPEATMPLLAAATTLLDASWRSAEPQAGKLRAAAESLARQAMRLDPGAPIAQDVMRQIVEGRPVALHDPAPAAAQAQQQAETLFVQKRFDEARKTYETAMARDPLWSAPWIGAGDCYYMQQDWANAEAMFRRAAAIEPHDDRAWRYLSDSLLKQGKDGAAEQALYEAIGANPAERNSWGKLAALRARAHTPLKALHLQRASSVTLGADGKYTVNVDGRSLQQNSTPDTAFALALAMAEARARNEGAGKARPAFDIEVAAWQTALQIAGEANAKAGQGFSDPALLQMQALARDGQLEAALLILQYRPVWRAALDAWLQAHPGGVKAFIERYGIQP